MVMHRPFGGRLELLTVYKIARLLGRQSIMVAVCVLVGVLAWLPPAQAQRIAAVVNDQVVSVRDLRDRSNMVIAVSKLPRTTETHRRLWPQMLRRLIDEQLQLQEARRLNVATSERELDRAKRAMEARNKIPHGQFEEFVKRLGINPETVSRQMKASIVWAKLVRRRFSSTVVVSEHDIDEALTRLEGNRGKEQLRLTEILLTIDEPSAEDQVRVTAERLAKEISAGGDMRGLAREFSKGPTAATGGDTGWTFAEQLPSKLQPTLQALTDGQISAPVRTVFGYHLVRIDQRRVLAQAQPLDAVVVLKHVFLPLAQGSDEAQAGAQLDLAGIVSESAADCSDMDRLAKELRSPAGTDLGKLKIRDIALALRETVLNLQPGQVSAPVRLPTGYSVLMVCERAEPASQMPGREEIRLQLAERKFGIFAQRYIRDLRRSAFIETRL